MGTHPHPKVSVVIVTYNSKDEFRQCIESLQRETIPLEIIVVDNASNIEFREILAQTRFPNLKIILNDHNRGLAYANNQPMGMCSGDYILILNPDTVIREGAIERLSSYLDTHEQVGVVGPKVLTGDGSIEPSFESSYKPILRALSSWLKIPSRIASQRRGRAQESGTQNVLFVSGDCLMIRRSLFLGLGGYDPGFFLALEDVVDLCVRVQRNGYRVVYHPDAEIVHWQGRSHRGYYSIFWGYQGHLYYQAKYGSRISVLLLRIEMVIDALLQIGIMLPAAQFNERYRVFLFVYAFTASKLLTHRIGYLHGDGLRLNAILSAKLGRLR